MNILLTGARGFVGSNLKVHLDRRPNLNVLAVAHDASDADMTEAARTADFVVHLAGVNRPTNEVDFARGNSDFTSRLCKALTAARRPVPMLYASSIQAERDNPYGRSKRAAEEHVSAYGAANGAPVYIFRLPNVFGKWCRPNYNSAVATFCHNIARDLPIEIHDRSAPLMLAYIDDVVTAIMAAIDGKTHPGKPVVEPVYTTTVGAIADQIRAFRESRASLISERVGTGLTRALYATYLSYLPTSTFSYELPAYDDPRGVFVEMLKTPDAGQFSFFSARPGVTRGGHFHHTKTEKFLVIRGEARFGFRHVLTGETFEITTSAVRPEVVETVPGWSHDITNIGNDDLLVMLWASEIFDRANPDTYAHAV